MDFTERAPIEAGFSEIFDTEIAPELDRVETDRQELLRKARLEAGVPLAIAALLAAWSLLGADDWEGALVGAVVALAFGGVIAFFLWRRRSGKWGNRLTETVMPPICRFLGDLEHDKGARKRFPLERIQGLGLIGSFNRSSLEDRLDGSYRDTAFELVEAHLRQRTRDSDSDGDNNSRTRTVFKGLLMRIGVPEPVETDILIDRDLGSVGNKLGEMFSFGGGRSMPRVDFDHPEFEAAFAVYADAPDAARRIMPPGFLDTLLAIAEAEGGDKGARAMRAGFQDDSFYLALERRRSFLEVGGLTRPVHDIEDDLHAVFADLALIRRIIDRLHGDAPSV
jgi:hypothetical protein